MQKNQVDDDEKMLEYLHAKNKKWNDPIHNLDKN